MYYDRKESNPLTVFTLAGAMSPISLTASKKASRVGVGMPFTFCRGLVLVATQGYKNIRFPLEFASKTVIYTIRIRIRIRYSVADSVWLRIPYGYLDSVYLLLQVEESGPTDCEGFRTFT